MQMTESSTLMSPSLRSVVETSVDSKLAGTIQRQSIAREQELEKQRQRWQEIIDRRLIEWGRDPSQLEDDDLEAPTTDTIVVAIRVAQFLCDERLPAPTNVVPDTDRGIVFERRQGPMFESVRIMHDGNIDVTRFENCHLVERHQLIPDSSIADK